MGLRFCARAFSSCGKRGPLFIVVRGPLTIVASLVAEHRLQMRRLSNCGSRAQLLRGTWDLPRAPTRVPCIGRKVLNHCATREAQRAAILNTWGENENVLAIKIYTLRNCSKPYFKFLLLNENIRNGYEFSLMSSFRTPLLTVFCFKLN